MQMHERSINEFVIVFLFFWNWKKISMINLRWKNYTHTKYISLSTTLDSVYVWHDERVPFNKNHDSLKNTHS